MTFKPAVIDFAIVAAFVIYSVTIGLRSRKKASTGLNEYFLAGRSVSGTRAGFSMAATQFAADTPLLVMGLIAMGGIFSLWRLWIYGLAFLMMGFILAAAWRRSGILTDAELVMTRYSARGALMLRGLKAIYYGTIINCVVMAFVLIAAVRIFEIFLPWNDWLPAGMYSATADAIAATGLVLSSGVTGLDPVIATTNNVLSIAAMLAFVALYSTTGGLRSVIATDVVQLALMLAGTAIYAWLAVGAAGGLADIPDRLVDIYGQATAERFLSFVPQAGDALMPFLVIIALQWFFQMNSDGTGYLAQRTMACRDHQQARLAAVVFTMTQVVVRSLLWLLIGIALLIVYPFDASAPLTEAGIGERELTFALGMDELLPVGARGLMLTGMLAALASTLDTHLNWGASYWSNDLYKGIWVEGVRGRAAGRKELLLAARLSNIVILGIALAIMANLQSIQTAWQISLLFGAGTGAVLVLRWLWERINLWCEVAAIAISLILAPILIYTVDAEWLRLLLMSAVSLVVVILVAYVAPATNQGKLVEFYQRVRPPGAWRRTAIAAGDDPARGNADLRRDLAGLIACAASVYSWLIGCGWLLLDSDRVVQGIAAIAVGLAACPVWLKSLRE
ncbi:MAG: Na+:solute symporter [Gammaproteobacteria bacterium]|nr:Na+:solute symporter [Gammaproteobacteria bacterium]